MDQTRFFVPPAVCGQADPATVFQFSTVRFSLLTPRLIRIESSQTGDFEDRPSQVFWYRRQPLPKADINNTNQTLSIDTDVFHLLYKDLPQGIRSDSLQVTVKDNGNTFHLDEDNPGQLPGTTRTLDETNGSVKLQPGLISRTGWVQLDDSISLVFNSSGWLEPRPAQAGYRDLYLLISGGDYKSALQDFQKIAGAPPLLPRAFLGNWWSRYWEYSQNDIKKLVNRFQQEEIPLSVLILDMDWHITKTGNDCSGWTGYSWNRSLFPDPSELMEWMHNRNLITSLNLHPAEGIHPHEDKYPEAASALCLDPLKKGPIRFDIADKRFAQVYFNQLLHPLEEQGVDFWWIDWQQGECTTLSGLDPLWWLNHLHFYDLARTGKKRSVVFSRWGGPGNHRYPIGFSGDTIVSWKTLAYQPYFTATAANAAYGWWSHDIGGHMRGMEDKELYTRWVQFGVLSPIFRLHCSKDNFIDRQPWAFDAETLRLTRKAMQFRHALVPYLYTMSRRNEQDGTPLLTPLYYDFPDNEFSYLANGQYMFGSELMAAPVVTSMDPDLNLSRHAIWFPPGEWFDFFNGERFIGSQWKIAYYGLDETPLFAKAGAILPIQAETTRNGTDNPEHINLLVFPGKDGYFKLYEDDGYSQDYKKNEGCSTEFFSISSGSTFSVRISPAIGDTKCVPQTRTYQIMFRGVDRPSGKSVLLNGHPIEAPMVYDENTRTAAIGPIEMRIDQSLIVELQKATYKSPDYRIEEKIMGLLRRARMETMTKWKISSRIKEVCKDVTFLADPGLKLTHNHLIALIETITGAGVIELPKPEGESHVLFINPNQLSGFKCRSRKPLKIDPVGTVLSNINQLVEVDYFGLTKKVVFPQNECE